MLDLFVPEADWAPEAWGVNHPLYVRPARARTRRRRIRLLGLLSVLESGWWVPRIRRRRAGPEPRGLILRPGGHRLPGRRSARRVRRWRGHLARRAPRHAARVRRGLREPAEHRGRARLLRPRRVLLRRRYTVRADCQAVPVAGPVDDRGGRSGTSCWTVSCGRGSQPVISRRRCVR